MTLTYRNRVAAYLKAHPGQRVSAYELMQIGGRMAWRTRVSECRRQLGMTIENYVIRDCDGKAHSFYTYVPPSPPAQRSLLEAVR